MLRSRALYRAYCGGLLLGVCLLFIRQAFAQNNTVIVRMRDACDPVTFNRALGDGTCKPGRHGTTKLEFFIEELAQDQTAGAWRFNPLFKRLNIDSGKQLMIQNLGGETHTFTRVAKFGGGFIPILNQLSGNPTPAPECLNPKETPTNLFVEAGVTESGPVAGSADLPLGVTRWECCIHPWMRLEVSVH